LNRNYFNKKIKDDPVPITTKAIVINKPGGRDVLTLTNVDLPSPEVGEVQIKHTAIGLNFIDVYHRTGLYPVGENFTPGLEGAGVVEVVGEGVTRLKVGDRVTYPGGPLGAYSERRNMPESRLVKLPDSISDETAAAMMLKGCTVEYLVQRTYPVKKGDWVLFHAAAGGVGLIACQWLNAIGAHVIGTVGSAEKAELAKANGCHHTILYRDEDIEKRVKEITKGQGVNVVYDSIGKDTFMASLSCLKPRGMMVTFGNATGEVEPMPPALLNKMGALFLTRPSLMHYYSDPQDFQKGCQDLLNMVTSGKIKISVNQTFALRDVAKAHEMLEARQTTGSTVLIP
jgi:NADPH2:quinone reductase